MGVLSTLDKFLHGNGKSSFWKFVSNPNHKYKEILQKGFSFVVKILNIYKVHSEVKFKDFVRD